jgi:hypothetical protein
MSHHYNVSIGWLVICCGEYTTARGVDTQHLKQIPGHSRPLQPFGLLNAGEA